MTFYTKDTPVPLSLQNVQYSPGNLDMYAFEELANNICKAQPRFTEGTFRTALDWKLLGAGGYATHC